MAAVSKSLALKKDLETEIGGLAVGVSRAGLFAGLSVLGFANGIVGRVQEGVVNEGIATALFATFNISAVVWVAFVACPLMFLREQRQPLLRTDMVVAAFVMMAFILPFWPLSWVALTGLAFYILRGSFTLRGRQPYSPMRSGAWILLATTGTMFWGRVLLHSASGPVLGADAVLVGWLAGTETIGNTVRFADGDGYVWIAPACSSLANISLAILCWVLFAQFRGVEWSFQNIGWCLLACLSVVVINVTRISLMVLHQEHFDLIHGTIGATVASWLSIAVVLGICMWGTRRARLSPT
ncbi:hypothetical protein [Falsiroseomonas sp.]|uniref:hypothetical protein n=1 Tax=Falsiroseomonas sp. TaxID=2870721 RepID=UPI0027361D85|nr:hypothetical protein [Falsiroseomonas sp.]